MKKQILSDDDVSKQIFAERNVSKELLTEDIISDEHIVCQKEDSILKEDIIPHESDIFDEDKNAPDCYELSALFFVYKFLFR